ncbi:hypothetical protein [Halorubrum trueperi]|uniref:Uncharacterized protein n=1 Tax=Halorubrum trueperi TaxID=2004704 RepID=A0ABD5UNT8_9EURY
MGYSEYVDPDADSRKRRLADTTDTTDAQTRGLADAAAGQQQA